VVRTGERYAARPPHAGAVLAETRFRRISSSGAVTRIEAEPVTGRTHQVRVHAAHSGFPILGDTLYGGRPSDRVHLHCRKLTLEHPTTGKPIAFEAPVDFTSDSRLGLRQALLPTKDTDAYRLIHSASDGWPGWYVDRLGECLLSQSDRDISNPQLKTLERWRREFGSRSAYHKILSREVGRTSANESSPQRIFGEAMADGPVVMENGIRFSLSMDAGYSVGLFLDQRDNRRRFLTNHVAADFTLFDNPSRVELLNTFAYTCGFSICAAKAGARTTSVDLSRKYLEWGKRNFKLNDIDPASHDFMYGDVFDWLKRLARKGRQFDAVVLDPPTFSRSKEHGDFRAEKDYGQLVKASLPLLKSGGVLFASTNAARLSSEASLKTITESIIDSRRRITAQHYAPQPPDFPISREEPAYLKTVWIRVS
jgi:23S rRNA (cytosine1962-C5)-methyltransferase